MLRLVILCLIAKSVLFAQTPTLAGVWEQKPAPNQSNSMMIRIDQKADQIEIAIRSVDRGQAETTTNRFIVNQETNGELHGSPMTARTAWTGSILVVDSLTMFGQDKLQMTDRFSISADGNTLTFREVSKFASEPERDVVREFERKPASSWEQDAAPKLAEQAYKNIQVLKGVSAARVPGVMTSLTRWLGVDCAHCHVAGAFEKDDKSAKNTARSMFAMVRKINQDNFGTATPVTCWTCHHGAAVPESLPK
jgi:hypothetical protein